MRIAGFALALALLASAAQADIVSAAPDSVRVTIYRDPNAAAGAPIVTDEEEGLGTGLAMVTETRTIDVPAGTSKIVFLGVADAIVPQTAGIEGLPAVILESNFDYDLLTPGAIVAKSHGERVKLVRTDPATSREIERDAIVRTGPDGVALEVDGRIEALDCSGLAEKLVFPRVPPRLADEPRLSMTVRTEQAGRHTIQLSYLALGLDWGADYVASINPDGRTLQLTGWLTLVNHASTTFANTPAEVVAGRLERDDEETQPPGANNVVQQAACWPIGSFVARRDAPVARFASFVGQVDAIAAFAPQDISEIAVTGRRVERAKLSELGDYKLYTLPEPTTIAARQSKQVQFLSEKDVQFTRIYTFRLDVDSLSEERDFPLQPITTLRLQNKKRDGLGKPLPAGTISVMETSEPKRLAGGAMLAGQDTLDDTPVGLPLDIELGMAMDVWIEPRVTADRTIEHDEEEDESELEDMDDEEALERYQPDEQHAELEVRFGNDKPVPIVLEYRHPGNASGFRVVSESRRHIMKSGDPLWTIKLRPGERTVLRYAVRRTDE